MECPFAIGQKVVCVGMKIPEGVQPARKIKRGDILTIRDIRACMRSNGLFQIGLYFNEVVNDIGFDGNELDFDHRAFRPLVEKKTDISIFKEMLNRSPRAARKHIRELVDV